MRALLGAVRRNIVCVNQINKIQIRKFGKPPRCDAHMNELPVPCGPFDIWYKDLQSFYNKILAVGVLWFAFSLGMLIYTDAIFFNWGPPAQPGPPSDMVEECDDTD